MCISIRSSLDGFVYAAANPPNTKEAIEWLYKASTAGHARAQYQLALCLHRGEGVEQSVQEAVLCYPTFLLQLPSLLYVVLTVKS